MKKDADLFAAYLERLTEEQAEKLREFFIEFHTHCLMESSEKKKLQEDFEKALLYYDAAKVPLQRALELLDIKYLGGFYARPSVLWFPLDDAAKIYPLSMQPGKMSVFRLSVYLKKDVVPELLQMVDEDKIALRPAVELSYLSHPLQETLCEIIDMEQCTPSHAQTIRMRKLFENNELTEDSMHNIMQEEKPNQKEKLVIRDSRVQKLLPKNLPISKREEYIIRALEYYGKYREKMRREQER